MRYSLLNRFRGALLGSLIGEFLGNRGCQGSVLGDFSFIPPNLGDAKPNQMLSDWSQIATYGIEYLINCGRLDVEDWVLYSSKMQPSLGLLKKAASSSEAAVAAIPIALFFHDDEIKLRQQLLACGAVWQQASEVCEDVLAIGYAIALALTQKLNCTTLIPQILAYLETSQTPLGQQLQQVQTLLEQGAGLDTTLNQLRRFGQRPGELSTHPSSPIALALYCFLSTPEDFRLCVSRAARSSYQPQITTAIAGALAGVYNSHIGIPVSWRLAANRISIGSERLQLAERLLAVWSGVYDISVTEPCQWVAVAAPRVIQPR